MAQAVGGAFSLPSDYPSGTYYHMPPLHAATALWLSSNYQNVVVTLYLHGLNIHYSRDYSLSSPSYSLTDQFSYGSDSDTSDFSQGLYHT